MKNCAILILIISSLLSINCSNNEKETSAVKKPVSTNQPASENKSSNKCTLINPAKIKDIAIDNNSEIVALRDLKAKNGVISISKNNKWKNLPGSNFTDLEVTASGKIYALKNTVNHEGVISAYENNKWKNQKGYNYQKIESSRNNLYCLKNTVNRKGIVQIIKNGKIETLSGANFIDLAIDEAGNLFGLKTKKNKQNHILQYTNGKWKSLPKSNYKSIVFENGNLAAINNKDEKFQYINNNWTKVDENYIYTAKNKNHTVNYYKNAKGRLLLEKCPNR